MKRIISIVLAAALALSMAACVRNRPVLGL